MRSREGVPPQLSWLTAHLHSEEKSTQQINKIWFLVIRLPTSKWKKENPQSFSFYDTDKKTNRISWQFLLFSIFQIESNNWMNAWTAVMHKTEAWQRTKRLANIPHGRKSCLHISEMSGLEILQPPNPQPNFLLNVQKYICHFTDSKPYVQNLFI